MQDGDAEGGEYGDNVHTVLMILNKNLPELVQLDFVSNSSRRNIKA